VATSTTSSEGSLTLRLLAQETNPAIGILCLLLTVFWILLILRVIESLAYLLGFRPPLFGPVRTAIDLLHRVTDPVLRPLQRAIPAIRMGGVGLDLSVLVAFVILSVLRTALEC
jgi:YggT family protein